MRLFTALFLALAFSTGALLACPGDGPKGDRLLHKTYRILTLMELSDAQRETILTAKEAMEEKLLDAQIDVVIDNTPMAAFSQEGFDGKLYTKRTAENSALLTSLRAGFFEAVYRTLNTDQRREFALQLQQKKGCR